MINPRNSRISARTSSIRAFTSSIRESKCVLKLSIRESKCVFMSAICPLVEHDPIPRIVQITPVATRIVTRLLAFKAQS